MLGSHYLQGCESTEYASSKLRCSAPHTNPSNGSCGKPWSNQDFVFVLLGLLFQPMGNSAQSNSILVPGTGKDLNMPNGLKDDGHGNHLSHQVQDFVQSSEPPGLWCKKRDSSLESIPVALILTERPWKSCQAATYRVSGQGFVENFC